LAWTTELMLIGEFFISQQRKKKNSVLLFAKAFASLERIALELRIRDIGNMDKAKNGFMPFLNHPTFFYTLKIFYPS
jgi:hypothetical protein